MRSHLTETGLKSVADRITGNRELPEELRFMVELALQTGFALAGGDSGDPVDYEGDDVVVYSYSTDGSDIYYSSQDIEEWDSEDSDTDDVDRDASQEPLNDETRKEIQERVDQGY